MCIYHIHRIMPQSSWLLPVSMQIAGLCFTRCNHSQTVLYVQVLHGVHALAIWALPAYLLFQSLRAGD